MTVSIAAAASATSELVEALGALLPQLTSQARAPDLASLGQMLAQPGLTLLIARDDAGRIVGTTTLVVVEKLSGRTALVEDVIVDAEARGGGIGAALTHEAIRLAREQGAQHVDLTSSPRREAANRLYQRLGFARRDTNVYRLALTP